MSIHVYTCVTSSSLESVVPPNNSISRKVQATGDRVASG